MTPGSVMVGINPPRSSELFPVPLAPRMKPKADLPNMACRSKASLVSLIAYWLLRRRCRDVRLQTVPGRETAIRMSREWTAGVGCHLSWELALKELGQVLFELLLKMGRILDRVEDGSERTIGTVTPPLNELVEGGLGQALLDLGFVLQGNHRGAVLPIDQQIGNTRSLCPLNASFMSCGLWIPSSVQGQMQTETGSEDKGGLHAIAPRGQLTFPGLLLRKTARSANRR